MNFQRSNELATHVSALRRLALELVGANGPWEDLVQGTLLRALQRPPRVLSLGWLRSVLRNRAMDHYRRRSESELEADGQDSRGPAAEDVAQRLEWHQGLVEAMGRLPEPYRQVLFMRYFEDRSPVRIANQLDIPVKTVKTRLVRGLGQLRQVLKHEFRDTDGGWMAAILPLAFPQAPMLGASLWSARLIKGLFMLKKVAVACVVVLGLVAVQQWSKDKPVVGAPLDDGERGQSDLKDVDPVASLQALEAKLPESTEAEVERQAIDMESEYGRIVIQAKNRAGMPLEGIAVTLHAGARAISAEGLGYVQTGRDGMAHFNRVQPGAYTLGGDCNQVERVMLGKKETLHIEWTFEGVAVQGEVVDWQGRSVPGAEIWIQDSLRASFGGRFGTWNAGRIWGRADQNGRFELALVPEQAWIGAVAPGCASSKLVNLWGYGEAKLVEDLRLMLTGPGGALSGIVVDTFGRPLEGARVAVALEDSFKQHSGGDPPSWSPRGVLSSRTGAYGFDGLRPGKWFVSVKCEGYSVQRNSVIISPKQEVKLDLELILPGSVEGTLVDAKGKPAVSATVRAFPASAKHELNETLIPSGVFQYRGVFGYPAATCDEQGRYRLEGVAPGSTRLFACHAQKAGNLVSMPFAEQIIAIEEGKVARWDAEMEVGQSIAGHVLFQNGAPARGVSVSVRLEGSSLPPDAYGVQQIVHTDVDGHFELIHLHEGRFRLRLDWRTFFVPKDSTFPQVHYVNSGTRDLQLVTDWDEGQEPALCELTCRVDDAGGRISKGLRLWVNGEGYSYQMDSSGAGAYRLGELKPGTYMVSLFSAEHEVWRGEMFTLLPGEERDLGVIKTEQGGRVVLLIDRSGIAPDLDLRFWLQHEGVNLSQLRVYRSAKYPLENLTPGSYRLLLVDRTLGLTTSTFRVLPGREISVSIRPEPGANHTLRLAFPDGAAPAWARVEIFDMQGSLLDYVLFDQESFHEGDLYSERNFPEGEYRLVARAEGGLQGERLYEVGGHSMQGAGQPGQIVIEME